VAAGASFTFTLVLSGTSGTPSFNITGGNPGFAAPAVIGASTTAFTIDCTGCSGTYTIEVIDTNGLKSSVNVTV
jgi:hypothetical protein